MQESYQKLSYFPGPRRNLRNPSGKCLDVWAVKDKQHQPLTFWHCHDGANQGFTLDTKGVEFPAYPLKDGVFFQIKTQMKSRRALRYSENLGGHQYRLRIQDNDPYNIHQWWTFDTRTRTIRPKANLKFAITMKGADAVIA